MALDSVLFIAVIIGLIALIILFYKRDKEKEKEKEKWGEKELLKVIYKRLGWILFWLIILVLVTSYGLSDVAEEICRLRGGILC